MYKKVSAGSITCPSRLSLSIDESSNLEVNQCLDKFHDQDALKLRISRREQGTVAGADIPGPLRNLLSHLNKSPSAELLARVADADRGFEGHERVALMDPSLKEVLKGGQIPSQLNVSPYGSIDRFFRAFDTKARTFEDEGDPSDDCKNLEDYDPYQEPEVYEYSSDVNLELIDPFHLARSCSNPVGEQALETTLQARKWTHVRTYRKDTASKTYLPEVQVISTLPFPDRTLSPYLLIYSLARNSNVSDPSKITFESMMSHYGYLTMDEDCKGFSVFQLPKPENEIIDSKDAPNECWLLVQEFDMEKGEWREQDWLELKRKEAKHWWYKNGWQSNSVVFYRREGLSKAPGDASSMDEMEQE